MPSVERRLVGVKVENIGVAYQAQGTHNDPTAADVIPSLRTAKVRPASIRTDRPTLRLSLSDLGDIAPGKALVDIDFSFELHADSRYAPGAPSNTWRGMFARVMQGAGYRFWSEAQGIYAYGITGAASPDNGALRHQEIVVGTGVVAGDAWRVMGDAYSDDGMLFVDHGATGTFTGASFSSARGAAETAFPVGARNVTEVFAWSPESGAPDPSSASFFNGMQTLSLTAWLDGKRLRAKGCMGNVEFQFNHGDAIVVSCSFRGVLVDYVDSALPTGPNDLHKYPPTFLGSRLTVRQAVNAPTDANRYGTDGVTSPSLQRTGALNKMRLSTGNEVVARESSIDPNGIDFARIVDRSPVGSFNPDDVNNSQFNFVQRFVNGVPHRLRCVVNGPGASVPVFDNPATNNQNSFAFIAPGIVYSGLQDGERDRIHVLDASFDLTGGDYDTSASGELPGNDNEFVILHY